MSRAEELMSLEDEIKLKAKMGLSASAAIWLQLPEETDTQFQWFVEFMDLPKKGRTMLLACNNYRVKKGEIARNTIPGAWIEAKRNNHWIERIEAFDAFMEVELRDYVERQQYLQLIEFQRKQISISNKVANAADLLIDRAIQALGILQPEDIRASTLSNYIRVASDASKMSLDVGASALALDSMLGKIVGAGELTDVAGFTEDELAKFEESALEGIEGLE